MVEEASQLPGAIDRLIQEHPEWVIAASVHSVTLTLGEERYDAIAATNYLLNPRKELGSIAIPFRTLPRKGIGFLKKKTLEFGRSKLMGLDESLMNEEMLELIMGAYHDGNYAHPDKAIWGKHLVDTF